MNIFTINFTPEQRYAMSVVSKTNDEYTYYLFICGLLAIYGKSIPIIMPTMTAIDYYTYEFIY